jgi:hypothetical protein
MRRYRKRSKKDEKKRKRFLGLGLERIEGKEEDDDHRIGYWRGKVIIFSSVECCRRSQERMAGVTSVVTIFPEGLVIFSSCELISDRG